MSKTQPTAEVRVGQIKAAIWKNETDTGPRFNVTVTRIYKDGDEWKYSETFGRNDLLILAKVLDRAHDRIYELQMELAGE
jgi:hypothetical protein